MRKADLILVKGTGFISDAIEAVSHSRYSHVAGAVKDNELIEAEGFRRIGYQALDYYDNEYDVFTCDTLSEDQRSRVVDYVESKIGGHYDYVLLFLEAIRYLFHKMPFYIEKPNSRICSTLWSDAYRSVGVDLCPGVKYPSPEDVAESKLLRRST